MISKPLVLIGTPRTGSTLFYEVIAEYLRQTAGTLGVGEIFNRQFHSLWDAETRLVPKSPDSHVDLRPVTHTLRPFKYTSRLDYLILHRRELFAKILTTGMPSSCFQPLHENFEWIYVERRNLLDQLLSYLISSATRVWFAPGGIRLPPASLDFEPEHFSVFESSVVLYHRLKAKYGARHTLVYEDYEHRPEPCRILTALELHQAIDLTKIRLPERQNPADKLRCFKKPGELLEAYRNSFLQGIRAI